MKLSQIVIVRVEEPVDEPRGEVFKIIIFDGKGAVDEFHSHSEEDAVDTVRMYLEDLRSQ